MRELAHVNGVLTAVPFRTAGVRITRGAVQRTTSIMGMEGDLYRIVDAKGDVFSPPVDGILMARRLAQVLGVRRGDTVDAELLDRGGEQRAVVVSGLYDPMMTAGLAMDRRTLNHWLGEQDAASGAYLSIAPGRDADVLVSLKNFPGVGGATSRAATIRNVEEQIANSMVFVLALITTSACVIAAGVVYNSARIALSERGRELASLRVLGFTTNEVSGMLLGEQAGIMIVALPAGVVLGVLFSYLLSLGFANERFEFPFVIAPSSALFAASVVVIAGVGASVIVRRRVGRLDMVTALRTRE